MPDLLKALSFFLSHFDAIMLGVLLLVCAVLLIRAYKTETRRSVFASAIGGTRFGLTGHIIQGPAPDVIRQESKPPNGKLYPPVELRQAETAEGLVVWLLNNTADEIECSVSVVMIEMRDDVGAFASPVHFSTLHLIWHVRLDGFGQTHFAAFVTVFGSDKVQVRIEDCTARKRPFVLTEDGMWRAKLYINSSGRSGDRQSYNEWKCFSWKPGSDPRFEPDPSADA